MMKKVLITLFLFFSALLIFIVDAKAAPVLPQGGIKDPTTEIMENLPFDASGASCGVPNSSANKCCEVSDLDPFKITGGDIDSIIADIEEGLSPKSVEQLNNSTTDTFENDLAAIISRELSPKSLDHLATLYLVQGRDPEEFAGYVVGLLRQATNESRNITPTPVAYGPGRIRLDPFSVDRALSIGSSTLRRQDLIAAKKKLDTLSDQELLVLNVRKRFFDDWCLINGVVHGFCMRGMAEFFAKKIGGDPALATVLHIGEESVPEQCVDGEPQGKGDSCICVHNPNPAVLCHDYLENDPKEFAQCNACASKEGGIWTGVGCVRLTITGFIGETLLGWGLSLAAIVTLLCIIYSAFILQTSQGNPERIKKAREYLTNCILGLLLILFSIFILRLVGVTILNIPGFR